MENLNTFLIDLTAWDVVVHAYINQRDSNFRQKLLPTYYLL